MKKLFGLWKLKEARSFHAPVKNITSCNLSVDYGTAKYVIFEYADTKYYQARAFSFVVISLARPFSSYR